MDRELTYEIPPDIVHYEVRTFFGLTIMELLLTALGFIAGYILLGGTILGGLLVSGVVFLFSKRLEVLGDRSIAIYFFGWLQTVLRNQQVMIPRTLPLKGYRIRVREVDAVYEVEAA